MKKLLCIVGSMNTGGAETLLMKIYRHLDRSRYQIDFCVASPGKYDSEIQQLGGNILFTVPKSSGPVKAFCSIRKIVSGLNKCNP